MSCEPDLTLAINTLVGGVMGYAMMTLISLDRPALGVLVLAAWLIGMVSSLYRGESE
jgi:hypothetical protein